MSTNLPNIAQTFLNELSNSKDTVELLDSFLNELENKNDPTPEEIRLASNIYQFFEKMNLLRENLRSYVVESYNLNNTGNKLDELLQDQGKFKIDI